MAELPINSRTRNFNLLKQLINEQCVTATVFDLQIRERVQELPESGGSEESDHIGMGTGHLGVERNELLNSRVFTKEDCRRNASCNERWFKEMINLD